ncbi:MAG: zinc ribbon domain-containing protein [Chloroflexi bacterium]|nr:zinc ribbon domain-containing protein [Chloroflexota bacterium]
MNWFERNLNLTAILGLVASWTLLFICASFVIWIEGDESIYAGTGLIITIAQFYFWAWILDKKGRSLAWLILLLFVFPIGFLALLVLRNLNAPTQKPEKEEMHLRLVGNNETAVYHLPLCRLVSQIDDQNDIWFYTISDAQASGFSPCEVCKPETIEPSSIETSLEEVNKLIFDNGDEQNTPADSVAGNENDHWKYPCPQCRKDVADHWITCPYCDEQLFEESGQAYRSSVDNAQYSQFNLSSGKDDLARAELHFQQADEYEESGDLDMALRECDTAISIDPYLAGAYNLRGIILEKMGQRRQAINDYERALDIEPGFEEANDNLATLREKLNARKDLITIAAFSYPTEVYLQQAKLESEGIQVFIADDYTVTMNWLYSNAISGVKLQVEEKDISRARAILYSDNSLFREDYQSSKDDSQCPRCGSLNTHYKTFDERLLFGSWFVTFCIIGYPGFPLPFLKRKWKCSDCNYEWKLDEMPTDSTVNVSTDLICPRCGEIVAEQWRACRNCGEKLIEVIGYTCSECGNDIDENWNVCPYCGTSLEGID